MANQKQASNKDDSKTAAQKTYVSQAGGMLEGLPELQQAHSDLKEKGAKDFKADQQAEASAQSKGQSDDR